MIDLIKREDAIEATTDFLNMLAGDTEEQKKSNRFLAEMIINRIPTVRTMLYGYISNEEDC